MDSYYSDISDSTHNSSAKIVGGIAVGAVIISAVYYIVRKLKKSPSAEYGGYGATAGAENEIRRLNMGAPCNTAPPRVPMMITSDRGGATNTQVDPSLHIRQDRSNRSARVLAIHDPMNPGDLSDILPSCESETLNTGGKDPRLPSSYMATTMVAVLPRSKLNHDPFVGDVLVEAPRVGLHQTRFRLNHLRPGLFGKNGDKVAEITAKMAQSSGPSRSIFEAYGV